MRYYGYEEFLQDLKILKQKIDFAPEAIIIITRGGLTLGHFLANAFDVRDVYTIKAELYDKEQTRCDISVGETPDLKNVNSALVVDEISDSGKTLECVTKALKIKNPETQFKSAVLFCKKETIFTPDYWVKENDEWIEFFWENSI